MEPISVSSLTVTSTAIEYATETVPTACYEARARRVGSLGQPLGHVVKPGLAAIAIRQNMLARTARLRSAIEHAFWRRWMH
jgi:hypothetical protein